MENVNAETSGSKGKITGVAYPVENIDETLELVDKIVSEHGTGRPISKAEISETLKRTPGTLGLFFSTLVQYGIFTLIHGKGYQPTDLYLRYKNPHDENDPKRIRLLMFKKAPLYSKIIDNLNNHALPASEKMFANRLKSEPYNINENSADRAARIFFENARALGLLGANNTFHFSLEEKNENKKEEESTPLIQNPTKQKPIEEENLFELPIPLPGKRKAYLHYPLEDLSKRDIRVIQKALEFIASSIEDYEEDSKKGKDNDFI